MTTVETITMEMDKPVYLRGAPKSIVVATDGSDTSLSAFQAASLIAKKNSATVHVLSVLEPLPAMLTASDGLVLLPNDYYAAREDRQKGIVREQTVQFDSENKWKVTLRVGRAAETIVAFAHEIKADMIIVGANKHGIVGRIFGEETAMEIARLSDVPLLVARTMTRLPKRIVVAMDLEPDGMQCAPAAVEMLADTPSISCAHAKPRAEFLGIDWASYDQGYETAMQERFKSFKQNVNAANLRPHLIVLHGEPAHELVDYSAYCKAELVVVGIRRLQGRERAPGGKIAGRVIRGAGCNVLVVPRTVARESGLSLTHAVGQTLLTI